MLKSHTNKLIEESSPYLLQHAHNPVHWYPWGDEALNKAKKENKLLIISIGYAACHWCHVMEHESFEDQAVAQVMNDNFICIKVDREERPDIDQIYMNAVYLISGHGGWPLNAFALPDGKPVYAGTYYPKAQWLEVLGYFARMHVEQPLELQKQAAAITDGINKLENMPVQPAQESFSESDLEHVFNRFKSAIDFNLGGRKGAPKFSMPQNWAFLLQHFYHSKNMDALRAVTVTLDNMAYGGIYDHLGGGFARYSTDAKWLVPHFEKMLYDNAQLASLYANAFKLTGNEHYKHVVYETLEFIEREMTSAEGGFYSSLDADSEGEEGKFYVWANEEIEHVLGTDAKWFSEYYNITANGNWEHGKNILHTTGGMEEFSLAADMGLQALGEKLEMAKNTLMQIRNKRIRPGLDDKILTSWNSLMLKGYVDAYTAFKEKGFLEKALNNANFLLHNIQRQDGGLYRNYKNGRATINAFLDDYTFTISALLALYQATFDERWIYKSKELLEYADTHFYDTRTGMYFYTSDEDPALIARQKEMSDNVIPASNSEMAKNLFVLGTYFNNGVYLRRSEEMMLKMAQNVKEQPAFYSNWAELMIWQVHKPYEVAITGEQAHEKLAEMNVNYLPDVLYLGSVNGGTLELLKGKAAAGKTTIHVCKEKVCKLPVTDVREALQQIK